MNTNLGRLYGNNDMVKVGCHDCAGCFSCCSGMGESIWLDPYDVYHMTMGLGKSFEELLVREVELHVEDGLILPNIRMVGNWDAPRLEVEHAGPKSMESKSLESKSLEPRCSFLNEEGRCSIHAYRPGFCRLFPLGRNYENGTLTYFLLEDACPVPNKTKMKINKWLNVPRIKDYEDFLVEWHYLTKGLRAFHADNQDNEAVVKAINMKFLQIFYLVPYVGEDFYPQFAQRLESMKEFLMTLGVHLG